MEYTSVVAGSEVGHYWKTSKTGFESWMGKIESLLQSVNGDLATVSYIKYGMDRHVYVIAFTIRDRQYFIEWPVLDHAPKDSIAAKIQAITFIYHEIKAAVVRAKVIGESAAFSQWAVLSDGINVQKAIASNEFKLLSA